MRNLTQIIEFSFLKSATTEDGSTVKVKMLALNQCGFLTKY